LVGRNSEGFKTVTYFRYKREADALRLSLYIAKIGFTVDYKSRIGAHVIAPKLFISCAID
jgi:hypothetical protein